MQCHHSILYSPSDRCNDDVSDADDEKTLRTLTETLTVRELFFIQPSGKLEISYTRLSSLASFNSLYVVIALSPKYSVFEFLRISYCFWRIYVAMFPCNDARYFAYSFLIKLHETERNRTRTRVCWGEPRRTHKIKTNTAECCVNRSQSQLDTTRETRLRTVQVGYNFSIDTVIDHTCDKYNENYA